MNKIILSLLSIVFLHGSCFSMESKRPASYEEYVAKAHYLKAVAERYQKFLSQFGQEETGDLLPTMKALFAPDIKKFVNDCHNLEGRKPVATTIKELYAQISSAKNEVGIWSVIEEDIPIASVEENMVIAHFQIPTQKKGTIVVMKKLICNDNGLINEINEVFNFKTK